MEKLSRYCLTLGLLLGACTSAPPTLPPPLTITRWAAYYDTKESPETFRDLDLVVFDREHHPDLTPLKGGPLLLAYVSLGELHGHAPEKPTLAEENIVLQDNTRWNSHVMNIASPTWRHFVLRQIEDALAQGFDGVMLDTIDSPLALAAAQNPDEHAATRAAAIALIRDIREAHPSIKIMLNRGFEILPDVKDQLDLILVESILTNPDDSTGQFVLSSPITYDQAATQLHRVAALAPHLHILTLDYWNLDDAKGLELIYATQRANGFVPYVTSQDLRRFTPEPGSSHH